MPHIETSAKTNENVTEMFTLLVKRLIERHGLPEPPKQKPSQDSNQSDGEDSDIKQAPITTTNSGCSCVIS